MSQCYSRPLAALTLLLATFLFTCVHAQTVIGVMDFDGTGPEITVSTNIPFFDDLSEGFYGILDNNGDPNDGTPMDTGDGGTTNPTSNITLASLSGDYLYVRDQDNTDSGGNGLGGDPAVITFGPVDLTGQTGVSFAFDYQVFGFESSDLARYEFFLDGVGQGEVDLREGLSSGQSTSGTVNYCVIDAATSITLELRIDQNGESDQAAFDNFVVTANSGCAPECGVSLVESSLALTCDAFTTGTDAVSGSINYLGIETGVTVTIDNGAVISSDSDDPATQEGGTQNNAREIRFENLVEGGTYTVTVAGNACADGREVTFQFTVANALCQPIGDIVINEFLARITSGSPGEFVELFNRGTTDVDISGYTIEDGSGAQNTVAAGTVLAPGEGFVFADAPTSNGGCTLQEVFGLSLNDGGDVIILRTPEGAIIHQISYDGADLTAGVSRALSPDGNIDGGYQNHTMVSSTGADNSPCAENIDNSIALPVTFLSFTATTDAKRVALRWTTTNEEANNFFEIQRQTNGGWDVLGTVAAANNRTSEHHYTFTDDRPAEGTNYYRLRQVDLTGTFSYSASVSATVSFAEQIIYPNPTSGQIQLSAELRKGQISLFSAGGRFLRQLPTNQEKYDLHDLAPGVYVLRVTKEQVVTTLRFVKQ